MYLAGSAQGALDQWDWKNKPLGRLCTFASPAELKHAVAMYARGPGNRPSSFMLDSGAYSAFNSGKTIDIDELIKETKNPMWDEAVGLDVIGSALGSRKNADYMLAHGSTAMPVFHIGDDWALLEYYCERWEKVGLSCRFGESQATSIEWYGQCFARAWPHKFHSFGYISDRALLQFPFHSADAATWVLAVAAYHWVPGKRNGRLTNVRQQLPKRALNSAMMLWMDNYYGLQQKCKTKWRAQLAQIEG